MTKKYFWIRYLPTLGCDTLLRLPTAEIQLDSVSVEKRQIYALHVINGKGGGVMGRLLSLTKRIFYFSRAMWLRQV